MDIETILARERLIEASFSGPPPVAGGTDRCLRLGREKIGDSITSYNGLKGRVIGIRESAGKPGVDYRSGRIFVRWND